MFSGEEQTVRLRFANHLVGAVLDRFGKDVIVVADGPEHFKVTLNVVTSPKFYAWLFGFGTEVEILSPPSARQEMQRMRSRDLTNLTYACINHHVHWGAGSFPAETSESKLDTHRPDPDNAGVGNEIYHTLSSFSMDCIVSAMQFFL